MGLSSHEKMNVLLDQINLNVNEQRQYFDQSMLLKLEVFKQEKRWNFQFQLESILPIELFKQFRSKLQEAFKMVATVTFTLNYNDQSISPKVMCDYWQDFITQEQELSPAYADHLKECQPKTDNGQLHIQARNSAEATVIKNRLTPLFKQYCQQYGLPIWQLNVYVENEQEQIEKFNEQKALEDKLLVKKAMETKKEQEKSQENKDELIQIGYPIKEPAVQMSDIFEEEKRVILQGYIFDVETRDLRSGRQLLMIKMTDYTDSFTVKMFSRNDQDKELFAKIKKGIWVKVRGSIQTDNFSNELTMMLSDLNQITYTPKQDRAPENEKRVELHSHTMMSQMDAVVSAKDLVERAAKWGHPAIAITDHAVAQAFPEAHLAGLKHGIKVIYGVEVNLVDDGVPIAYNPVDRDLKDATYVVFDVETTGLSAVYDTIIELAAVKIKNGEIIDKFERFANPHQPLSQTIIDLTGITDDMLQDAPEVEEVLQEFHDWIGDGILVAHNAGFDIGFINQGFQRIDLEKVKNPVIDTLELSRFILPQLKSHRLNILCKHYGIELTQHHRAIYDTEATAYLLWKLVKEAEEKGITNHNQFNQHMGEGNAYQRARPYHATLLAKNEIGLKNLYKLISMAHVDYFYRVPRLPRSKIIEHREGILIGSACQQGEVFETMMQKSIEEAEKVADFYDYIEVQPPANYYPLIEQELVQNEAQIYEIIRNIVDLADTLNKPCVATGNVHYLDKEDKFYRQILIKSQKGNPLSRRSLPDVPFRTTDEMLECFNFLDDDKAKEIVVTNTQKLANDIEAISPVKKDLYTPNIEGADKEIRDMSYASARKLYGEELPDIVVERMEKELKSIIGHGFAVIYLISHKLVKKSLDDGYLVGSRGSVGSSLIATLTEITEVNPLPPHYRCPNCCHHEFFTDGQYASGYDLKDKDCPNCGTLYKKDGQDIPFETFLGFKGDKVPDIDLNFSGTYQPVAHNYTKELFGEDKVFRAGTIGTIAEKTAYGYVKGYANDHNLHIKNTEVDRLVLGCTGVKRTTGQHPGGIIVVPEDMDIYDFTPIQYPADDKNSEWLTTHFDFHSIDANLLKLDILGHDDPTMIRMLEDLSGIDPKDIPVDDEKVMKIFSSPEVLGVTPEQILCKTGTLGVPEFGTRFVRQMLEDTNPSTFGELVIISGLSHGTDVWLGNAQELINQGICELSDVIGCRDDIMVYLMHQGLDASLAFQIMESVRKGKGLTDEWVVEMKKHDVPDWYIDSCRKIKYMFPKAHASAYVLMALRIAYFKVHHPILFYAAYFTVRASDFELDTMIQGSSAIRKRIEEIYAKGNDATPKEKSLVVVLELALEMNERGFSFAKVDLYRSSATEFLVDGNQLIPPFNAIDGLGTNAALNIVKAREEGEFLSKEDLRERSRISRTVLDYLDNHGCLEGMEEKNQLSLF
ncbi:PolC-type DNA polymerase III [Amphibacillus xylanus]|uniref:DNA polymerase III PolC-type n=1 Tax=Amphibacillus xylanus (strain ATCC 51415 / DSM 6626 / JCM 7361 / LMG 17667 / NBRC 15112 / Ep01) TaxID=698758 RepID=K0IYJ9_AMPXN|nr:PolC-type DNA polymerase III [Amphibacillus xylanus]BAM47595.1 DNA polymerase III PolC-type [Amphibacillus xylanus NBRC 15112]